MMKMMKMNSYLFGNINTILERFEQTGTRNWNYIVVIVMQRKESDISFANWRNHIMRELAICS